MTRELIIENAFLFEEPIKAVWSDFHQEIMVLGKNIAYSFNPETFKAVPFQETEVYSFKDIAVAKNGEVALLLQSDSSYFGEIKILSPNLFSIEKKLNTSSDILKYAKFTNDNNLIVISELSEQPDEENIDSKVYFIDSKKTISEGLISTIGEIIGIDISPENLSLAISQGGDVVLLPSAISEFEADNSSESLNNSDESDEESSKSSMEITRFETKILGNIGTGVKSFSIGLKSIETSDATQMKVRVFVGSRPWQNDRWDSEEIETEKTSILYGGGDNLIPGRNYWVHVSVWHQDSGWSRPQIRKFTMPYRYYEDESSSSSSSRSSSTEIKTTSSSISSISSHSSSSISSESSSSASSSSLSSVSSESSSSDSSVSTTSDSSESSSSESSQSYLIEEGQILAVSGDSGNYDLSTNGGGTWTSKTFMTPLETGRKILMSSDGAIQILLSTDSSNSYIWMSTDTGANWTNVYTTSYIGEYVSGSCSADAKHIGFVITDTTQATYKRKYLDSYDYGTTWSEQSGGSAGLNLGTDWIMTKSGSIQYIALEEYIYSRTEPDQWVWPLVSQDILPGYNIKEIETFNKGKDISILLKDEYSIGTYVLWALYKSTDYGQNWTSLISPSSRIRATNPVKKQGLFVSQTGKYWAVSFITSMYLNDNYGNGSWSTNSRVDNVSACWTMSASESGQYMAYIEGNALPHKIVLSSDFGGSWSEIKSQAYTTNTIAISSGIPPPVSSSSESSFP